MIEKMTQNQLDEVVQIWLEANLEAHPFVPNSFWHDNLEGVREALPAAEVWVYADDEGVKGFAGVVEQQFIAGLFVDGRYRSAGIGAALIQHCQKNSSRLLLDVYVQNERAVRFYERMGFTKIADKTNEATGAAEYAMQWSKEA